MGESKKYYWLKLKRDFFKRHDIQIIEAMPNGKDYILFYLKLLCESVDHEGELRFSEQIPYNEQMLATITNTNVDIVRRAITVFTELGMMEMLDNGTLYMLEVQKMIGSETEWAKKKREYRNKLLIEDNTRTKKDNVRQEIEIEKDIEIDKKKKKEPKTAYGEYAHVKLTDSEYKRLVSDYGQDKTEKAIKFFDEYIEDKGYKSKSHNMAMRRWVFNAVDEQERKSKPVNKFNNIMTNTYTHEEMSALEQQLLEN